MYPQWQCAATGRAGVWLQGIRGAGSDQVPMQLHLIFVQVSSKVRMLSADYNAIHVSSCELTCRSGSSLLSTTGSSSCMGHGQRARVKKKVTLINVFVM